MGDRAGFVRCYEATRRTVRCELSEVELSDPSGLQLVTGSCTSGDSQRAVGCPLLLTGTCRYTRASAPDSPRQPSPEPGRPQAACWPRTLSLHRLTYPR